MTTTRTFARRLALVLVVLLVGWGVGQIAAIGTDVSAVSAGDRDQEVPRVVHARSAAATGASDPDPCAAATWVAAWAAPPQDSTAEQPPKSTGPTVATQTFQDQTLRMIVSPHVGGSRVRLELSNRFGREPVTFSSVSIARHAGGGALIESTGSAVTVAGLSGVTIGAGATVVTDELQLAVEPFEELAVTMHVVGPSPLDVHLFGMQTHYATAPGGGDHTGDASPDAFTEHLESALVVSALDVLTPRKAGAVVVLGDSITDGIGSTHGGYRRWPDLLAQRVLDEANAPALSIVNAGISGNQVTRDNVLAFSEPGWGMGPSTATRVDADALSRAGVTDVVVFAGINDLYMPTATDPVSAVVAGYRALIDRVRGAGVRVIGATLTPGGLPAPKEAQRSAINEWMRTSGAFDAIVDFDAVVRDPADPSRVDQRLAADAVHLNDAGYAALAGAVDLSVFAGTGCER